MYSCHLIEREQNSTLWKNYMIKTHLQKQRKAPVRSTVMTSITALLECISQIQCELFLGAFYGNSIDFVVDLSYSAQSHIKPDVNGYKCMYLSSEVVNLNQGVKSCSAYEKLTV